jgi:hypothetical protein
MNRIRLLFVLVIVTSQCIFESNSYQLVPNSAGLGHRFEYLNRPNDILTLHDYMTLNSLKSSYQPEDYEIYGKTIDALLNGVDNDENDEDYEPRLRLRNYPADSYENNLFELNADDDDDQNEQKDEEIESHSSIGAGFQYVSGGAGEGNQHLHPEGDVGNKAEVKSDEDLPAYCDPPNPCPVGYTGDDCDKRPFQEFTAEFSKIYQEKQNCMCDDDHNDCQKHKSKLSDGDQANELIKNLKSKISAVVAKKSPRVRRVSILRKYLKIFAFDSTSFSFN